MPKATRNRSEKADAQQGKAKSFIGTGKNTFDPALTSLFASSLGPVTAPPKSRYQDLLKNQDDEELSEADEEMDDDDESEEEEEDSTDNSDDADSEQDSGSESEEVDDNGAAEASEEDESSNEDALARIRNKPTPELSDRQSKKRKRGDKEAEVEDAYMSKLAREEAKDDREWKKKQKVEGVAGLEDAASSDSDSEDGAYEIPKHETQTQTDSKNDDEVEKASRTVFLGNVSSEAITSKTAKKTLMRHLSSFFDDIADHTPAHKVESLRFRSTAFASALPKKAAFSKKEVLDATTKSTNAYAVYSNKFAAREAVKNLNGSIILGRHLRVDSVAHPAAVDNRRCVFVGNLGFVDDESKLVTNEDDKKKKNKPPGDVEEGLWVQFSKAGKVESVRVVRDSKTRVGKGIAYVQFENENGVEAALQFNDQKFPPLLPRKLRVVRAKALKKKATTSATKPKIPTSSSRSVYNAKITPEQKTNQGRARAMLGKAGAFKSAESFVFEGHRASRNQGKSGLKLGGGKKKGGKPTSRSSKRGSAWKAGGGRK